MTVTLVEVLPLMRGHYVSESEMWRALEALSPLIVAAARRLAVDADHAGFAIDTLAELGLKTMRNAGLAFEGEHPADGDFGGWLAKNVKWVALDLRRKQVAARRKHVAVDDFDETRPDGASGTDPASATPEPGAGDLPDVGQHARDIWEKLRASQCPPNYRLALFAWYWPGQLTRADLEALATRAQRGKTDQASGLVRPVERAWPLVGLLRERYPKGIQRCAPAEDRFAWIVRSETPSFGAWREDKRELRKARETIGKWHLRGRKWLEDRRAQAVPA